MFDADVNEIEKGRMTRYSIKRQGSAISYGEVLERWQTDSTFQSFFSELLAGSPYVAFRWETPAIRRTTIHQPFELVLLNAPRYASRKTDAQTFKSYFLQNDAQGGIVSFPSLGGDAILVVPQPLAAGEVYGHLAAFVRGAPRQQRDALWQVIGRNMQSILGAEPRWLNTAGGGVAWLHVRIDSRPKYYGYEPFKAAIGATGEPSGLNSCPPVEPHNKLVNRIG